MTNVSQTGQEPNDAPGRLLSCVAPEDRPAAVEQAVRAVREGSCVVLPTDTFYGIGADAFSPTAVRALLSAKGRGPDMPPPVLIGDPSVLMALGRDIPEAAKKLADHFWPGALTLILHAQTSLQMDLGETRGTLAVRIPDHDLAREFLQATGPLAVSSANITGGEPAVTAAAARDQLGEQVAVYLDAGPVPGELPSTIVDFTVTNYGRIVRPGRISLSELREIVPYLEDQPSLQGQPSPQDQPSPQEQAHPQEQPDPQEEVLVTPVEEPPPASADLGPVRDREGIEPIPPEQP